MSDVILKITVGDAEQTASLAGGKTRIGRGSEADLRLDDQGLSRLNSTIYYENGRIWIVDEGSTNGTLINGVAATSSGTPLVVGDVISIGNSTKIEIAVENLNVEPESVPAASTAPPQATGNSLSLGPIIVIAAAVFVISVSVVFALFVGFGSNKTEVANLNEFDDEPTTNRNSRSDPSTTPERSPSPSSTNSDVPTDITQPTLPDVPSGKKYAEMSDTEKRSYVEAKAQRVAQVIGNASGEKIPPAALDRILRDVNAYLTRLKVGRMSGGCRTSDNLAATYERAARNAPFIVRAFNEKGMDPRIGLYLAMIESEHCNCLRSPTGPLGMFQFTFATAKIHFEPNDGVVQGASPANPDVRCQPEPAARAAASYMKALAGRYGTGPSSIPLAIGSYNSGEGGLSSNLQKALDANSGLPRDFWTLIANSEILSKQFQAENFKYVPKFFAAAIIGENPRDFGIDLNPLSTYSK